MTAREVQLPWHTFPVSILNSKCAGGQRLLRGTARFRETVRTARQDLGRVQSTTLELGRGLSLSGELSQATLGPIRRFRTHLASVYFVFYRAQAFLG